MSIRAVDSVELANRRVLIRTDFNVPIKNGKIENDHRIRAALPTLETVLQHNASVVLVSHLGRPKPGADNSQFTLRPVADSLTQLLGREVALVSDWQQAANVSPGDVVLLENIRFHDGETKNDTALARELASLCDIYVNDAFGTAHRAHASTAGVARFSPESCAGLLLSKEIDALEKALLHPERPLVALIGGAKIAGKLELLHNLARLADTVLVGGGMANTLLHAAGFDVGNSLTEPELKHEAAEVLEAGNLPLPVDVMTAESLDDQSAVCRLPDSIPTREMVIDLGPETARQFAKTIADARTIIWNGPMGVFERIPFAAGTQSIALACAETAAFTLVGGGDTVAAIEQFGVANQIDYVSTGGGAFLEYIAGNELPGIVALQTSE